ncbi:MAG: response regulator [Verrucomicrobium sp.]|nr:response regulator transcription factor [Verrucomicrobium sp.]
MPVRIAMIEDDVPFAETLQRYFAIGTGAGAGIEVQCLAHFPTAERALPEIAALKPDLVLVDINLPQMNGIEFVGRIQETCPGVLCLMLTMYEESPLIFDALKAGACGYLLKRTPPKEIVAAILQAHGGGSPMSPQVARQVVSFFHKAEPSLPEPDPEMDTLADREREVLGLLSKGFLYKEIADQLGISTHTVNSHIRRIYEKLHVRSRAQAVAKYRGIN